MSGALPPAPIPPPTSRKPTAASKLAWLPTAAGAGGIAAFMAITGPVGWIVGSVALVASAAGGGLLFRRHRKERAELDAKAFEEKALAVYRNHRGKTMTKEQVVRDHRLHPDDAERVLNWLVSHDLLEADWENYDTPMVYRRQGTAADATGKPALPAPRQQGQPRLTGPPVVHHHHHGPPAPHLVPEVKNPTLAGLLSAFWPGVGQMYSGDVGRGLAFMFGTALAWGTFVLGPFVHIWNIVDASKSAKNANLAAAGYDPRLPHLPPGMLPPPRPGYPPRPGPPGPPGSGGFGGSGY